ncbi:MAG: hypothetical protein HDS80_05765 [Bacteroidales bacterium]|nr:hypothetical protein [Bacteroidales bacterium]
MDNSKESWIIGLMGVGCLVLWLGLFAANTWTDRLIAFGAAVILIGISVLLHHFSKEEDHNWKSYGLLSGSVALISLLFFGALAGCNRCMEPTHHDYPYHNVETGRGQYEYGGSEEQMKQLIEADESLTEEEKAYEAEYERQVERELREMNE